MNYAMIRRLICKEWYFSSWAVLAVFLLGVLGLAIVWLGGGWVRIVGSVALNCGLVMLVYLPALTIISERNDQTLAFLMSLPISAREYTAAKVFGSLLIFIVPWALLMGASALAILGSEDIPDAAFPAMVCLVAMVFFFFVLNLGVSIVSESSGISMAVITAGQVLFWFAFSMATQLPGLLVGQPGVQGGWTTFNLATLIVAAVSTPLILIATFYLQSRKTDFI